MHYRLLQITLLWTLALLLLGSIVHATESSLACPDWPTCFGTMTPEMVGGVFWEHLHRLWAGTLVLIFIAAVVALRKRAPEKRTLFRTGLLGIGLLVVQSVLGGLTVIFLLPDAISTSHLTLAFLFLVLVTVMTVVTGPGWAAREVADRTLLRVGGAWIGGLIFFQSVLGALVRHTDAGVACPDVPLCLGRFVPPLEHPLVILHFSHRSIGVLIGILVLIVVSRVLAAVGESTPRILAWGIGIATLTQVILGFVSVGMRLHPAPVSIHTLLAASILAMATALATWGWDVREQAPT